MSSIDDIIQTIEQDIGSAHSLGENIMKTLYFCSFDGNLRKVFKSNVLAKKWEDENSTSRGQLAFVNDVVYDDNFKIISVNSQEFTDFVESISDDVGTEEFFRVKANLEKEWAFIEVTDD